MCSFPKRHLPNNLPCFRRIFLLFTFSFVQRLAKPNQQIPNRFLIHIFEHELHFYTVSKRNKIIMSILKNHVHALVVKRATPKEKQYTFTAAADELSVVECCPPPSADAAFPIKSGKLIKYVQCNEHKQASGTVKFRSCRSTLVDVQMKMAKSWVPWEIVPMPETKMSACAMVRSVAPLLASPRCFFSSSHSF